MIRGFFGLYGAFGFIFVLVFCAPISFLYSYGTTEVVRALGYDIAVDGDGRIVVAGYGNDDYNGSGREMTLWRYTTEGSPDASFNGNGLLRLQGDCSFQHGSARTVFVEPDGGLLVGGTILSGDCSPGILVIRLLATGETDPDFKPIKIEAGMKPVFPISGDRKADGIEIKDIAVDERGGIIILGAYSAESQVNPILLRYDHSGVLDTSFGSAGSDPPFVHYDNEMLFPTAMYLDSRNRVNVTGSIRLDNDTPGYYFTLWRFTSSGEQDLSFATSGAYKEAGMSDGSAICVDRNGRILATGSAGVEGGAQRMAMWAFSPSGSLDTYFAVNGRYVDNLSDNSLYTSYGSDILLDYAGNIVVAGHLGNAASIWRLTETGQIDRTFGEAGPVLMKGTANGDQDMAFAVAMDGNGRIVATGLSDTDRLLADVDGGVEEKIMATWRFGRNGEPDQSFGIDGSITDTGSDQ